jgi:hypothetical protein
MPSSSLERRVSEADAFDCLLGSPRACILEQLKSASVSNCSLHLPACPVSIVMKPGALLVLEHLEPDSQLQLVLCMLAV